MRARRDAERASLADQSANGDAQTIHPLVSRTMRFAERNRGERREQLRRFAVGVLTEQLEAQLAAGPRGDIDLLIPHTRQLAAASTGLAELVLVSHLATYDYDRGAFASARELGQRVLDGRRELLGERHPSTLAAMNDLAQTLHAQGGLAAARELEQQMAEPAG